MKNVITRSILIIVITIILLVLLSTNSRAYSYYVKTFAIDAYDYEYIIASTGDQTFNVKLTTESIYGYNPVTIYIFDKENFKNWEEDFSYKFINSTYNPDGDYYLHLNEKSRYYLVIDNSKSFFDSKITITLSTYGFYGGEIFVRENELSNRFYILFTILLAPLTFIAIRVSKRKKQSPMKMNKQQ